MKIKWKKKLKRGPESSFKAVYCIELNKTYESLAEASRKTGADRSSIRDNANGKLARAGRITDANGNIIDLHWRWA